jgi:hypothetical protein
MIREILPFIKEYIEALNSQIEKESEEFNLSNSKKYWLMFCLMGLLITNKLSWKTWERLSCGRYSDAALSRMFRISLIPWEKLLEYSTRAIIEKYKLSTGVLIIDDTDISRSQNTKKIPWMQRLKDKVSGGYLDGQNIVFLVLATDHITIPVGFRFYVPDTALKEWGKENKRLKKKGVKKKDRLPCPERNPECPTKCVIAYKLIESFEEQFPDLVISAVLADALYGSSDFVNDIELLYPKTQVVSLLRSTQLIINERGLLESLPSYFKGKRSKKRTINIRGRKKQAIIYIPAKLKVKAHGKKRLVIAVKFKDEKDYRYMIATDMSWRIEDVLQAYSLRWLVEVFIQDWKSHEGWSSMAKQQGTEGSFRGVILSLLLDHALFFHDDQKSSIKNKLPLVTIGSLTEKCRLEALLANIESIIDSDNIETELALFKEEMEIMATTRQSSKHLSGVGLAKVFQEAA